MAVAFMFIDLVDLELVSGTDRMAGRAVIVPERPVLGPPAFEGIVLRLFQAALIGPDFGLDRHAPGLGGRVVIGDRGLDDRVVEMLRLPDALRRFQPLIERREFRPAFGRADHAHLQFVIVAPSVEFVLILGEFIALARNGVDQVDGEMDVRMAGVLKSSTRKFMRDCRVFAT